jgi:hypothetical protein
MSHRLKAVTDIVKGDIKFEASLVQQLQERSAGDTGSKRRVLQRIEQGRHEQAKRLLIAEIASYYQSWKEKSNQGMTSSIVHELEAIEKAAESIPSLRAAIQNRIPNGKTSD